MTLLFHYEHFSSVYRLKSWINDHQSVYWFHNGPEDVTKSICTTCSADLCCVAATDCRSAFQEPVSALSPLLLCNFTAASCFNIKQLTIQRQQHFCFLLLSPGVLHWKTKVLLGKKTQESWIRCQYEKYLKPESITFSCTCDWQVMLLHHHFSSLICPSSIKFSSFLVPPLSGQSCLIIR